MLNQQRIFFPSRSFPHFVFNILLILACMGGAAFLQLPQIHRKTVTDQGESKREYFRQEKLAGTRLGILENLPNFGLRNLIADWMFLQFVQYMGDSDAREVTGYDLIPEYYQAIVERDPRFVSAHIQLSTANSIFAGQPKLTIELLDKSLSHISPNTAERAFQLWIYKATDEFLFRGNTEAAKQSYQKAQQWAKQSDHPGSQSIAIFAQRMKKFLETNPNTTQGRVAAWGMILMMSESEKLREKATAEVKALGGEVVKDDRGRVKGVRLPPEN